MGSVFLADRSTSQGPVKSNTNNKSAEEPHRSINRVLSPTGGQVVPTGLENWGWSDQVANWSRDEIKLLSNSWRKSTLNTYKAPIKRWLSFCAINNMNHKNPDGKDVARFLADLHLKRNFSLNTILLHKSAISTFCASNTENLSKNFFIQQVLKAIALAKPLPSKSPIWDTKLLFKWLKTVPSTNKLFDISRRTAIILLLASGRRIHDLTLLDISQNNFIQEEQKILLWPKFGSKTDSSKYRQSGWSLLKHPDANICPLRHIKQLIEASQHRRLNSNVTSLFVSIKGEIKPATRTIIAGWIKSIFKDLNLEATPGSVRAAVASKGWWENVPVEEILARGNWKSDKTFRKFYCREIINNSNNKEDDLLRLNFSGV